MVKWHDGLNEINPYITRPFNLHVHGWNIHPFPAIPGCIESQYGRGKRRSNGPSVQIGKIGTGFQTQAVHGFGGSRAGMGTTI